MKATVVIPLALVLSTSANAKGFVHARGGGGGGSHRRSGPCTYGHYYCRDGVGKPENFPGFFTENTKASNSIVYKWMEDRSHGNNVNKFTYYDDCNIRADIAMNTTGITNATCNALSRGDRFECLYNGKPVPSAANRFGPEQALALRIAILIAGFFFVA